jgi:hypothetical protein
VSKKVIMAGLIALCAVGLWAIEEPQSQEPTKEEMAKRLSAPRIAPLAETEWTEEQRKELEPPYKEGQLYNVVGTLARHWQAYKKFIVWGRHVLGDTSTLPPRERELLILRTGWLCCAEYEWGQHVVIGKKAGLTDEEITRIKEGPDAKGWRATKDLYCRSCSSKFLSLKPTPQATDYSELWSATDDDESIFRVVRLLWSSHYHPFPRGAGVVQPRRAWPAWLSPRRAGLFSEGAGA